MPQGQGQGQGHGIKAKASYLQDQGQVQNRTNKAYNADITLLSVQLFAFIKWLLPILKLRLPEVTVTGNLLRLAGKYWN